MSKAIPKECMALLKEASEMFSETGCVPGIDGEEVPGVAHARSAPAPLRNWTPLHFSAFLDIR
jgi:hypothetical protein